MSQTATVSPVLQRVRPAALAGPSADEAPLAAVPIAAWTVLRNCPLGGGPVLPLALLHPGLGVALVEPRRPSGADGPTRLRARLEVARFASVYPGSLPIVVIGAEAIADAAALHAALEAGFACMPPLDLPAGGAWVAAVERALMATHPPAVQSARKQRRPSRRRSTARRLVWVAGGLTAAILGLGMLALGRLPPQQAPTGGQQPHLAAVAPRALVVGRSAPAAEASAAAQSPALSPSAAGAAPAGTGEEDARSSEAAPADEDAAAARVAAALDEPPRADVAAQTDPMSPQAAAAADAGVRALGAMVAPPGRGDYAGLPPGDPGAATPASADPAVASHTNKERPDPPGDPARLQPRPVPAPSSAAIPQPPPVPAASDPAAVPPPSRAGSPERVTGRSAEPSNANDGGRVGAPAQPSGAPSRKPVAEFRSRASGPVPSAPARAPNRTAAPRRAVDREPEAAAYDAAAARAAAEAEHQRLIERCQRVLGELRRGALARDDDVDFFDRRCRLG